MAVKLVVPDGWYQERGTVKKYAKPAPVIFFTQMLENNAHLEHIVLIVGISRSSVATTHNRI
jgi:hypothetical protein